MVDFGCCVKCEDSCVITNVVKSSGEDKHITTCVKDCSISGVQVICEVCKQTFITGKKSKIGEIVK